ncbi:MAG TPA: ChbG/HpnK family deacetylase [Terracidiphilus sp.]|jgi:predicted glycoside hydrolase/deacetylase ChbG (UPF0249 family)|nr:ChbG/HpnK family deacetylase [Terracidiphilus sp.]
MNVVERTPGPTDQPNIAEKARGGALIINADDWGLDRETTDCIRRCFAHKALSSTSAMVFMADSVRASELAREEGIDTGLHLNLTEPFSGSGISSQLAGHQEKVALYLRKRRAHQAIFHPGLTRSFTYTVQAQLEEYARLYGQPPARLDGHHHMHLCANVLFSALIPRGIVVRRNFSFRPGEKGSLNRWYRRRIDQMLARRHQFADFFFALAPLSPPERLSHIFSLSRQLMVEVETHPVVPEEFRFLTSDALLNWTGGSPLATHYPKRIASVGNL